VGYDHRGRCAITGIGASDFSRASGRSALSLAVEASLAAIEDAGMRCADIDGVVRCEQDVVFHNDLVTALGLEHATYWGATGTGGAAPCGMIGQAVGALLSGQATAVLAYRSLNGRSGARYGRGGSAHAAVGGLGTLDEFFVPYGLAAPGQAWALIAQRHIHEFGTTSAQLGHIAVACRERANANPAAQMHGRPLTLADHQAGRVIADPLRLNDYCLETDGACAVVVTTTERALDGPRPPAVIAGVAQSAPRGVQGGIISPALTREVLTTQPSALAAATLYERCGLGPADVDVAQLYDCFTITVLVQLEDYGFCAKGEGGPFAAGGALELDGALPINTAGGNLSEGYIHGMNHIVEGVRQVRGDSCSQVPGAEVCLVTSGLPVATAAMMLTKGPR
jgi:acetyl-CoA acetyltransferase